MIALIRRSPSTDEAREGLKTLLEIDDLQANAILDMQLRRLAALERQRIVDQLAEFERIIADLRDILDQPERQRTIIRDELAEIVEKYGDERRTEIIAADGDLSNEDLIPDSDVVVTITRGGYAKRTNTELYRVQKRGGKGVRGATLRTDDEVEQLFVTTNHHWILFFTNQGRVYRAKVWQLPEAGRDARGGHVAGLLSFLPGEEIAQVLAIRDYSAAPYLLLATRRGLVKKTALPAYDSPRQAGVIAINFRDDDDELIGAELCRADDEVLLISPQGAVDPVPGRRHRAAADGPGDLGGDRDEVPDRRRAAVDVDHPGDDRGRRTLCLHRHRRRLRQADARVGVPAAGARRARHQGHETQRGSRIFGRRAGCDRE